MKIAAIVPAAGQGKRLSAKKLKPLIMVTGKPLLIHTLVNLKKSFNLAEIVLAVPDGQSSNFKKTLKRYDLKNIRVTAGGRTRAESVRNGFRQVSDFCDWVLVHDAARPLVSKVFAGRLLEGAQRTGAAIAVLPITSTIKKVNSENATVAGTADRRFLCLAQTPQVFKKSLLAARYKKLGKKALSATDEAALFDGSGVKVSVVPGEARNIKITMPEDIELFKFYLRRK